MAALRITQQPDEIFFKEEGGASHTLRVTVTHPAGAPPPTVPLPLAFTLLLEDGELGPSNFLKIKQVHPKSSIDESNTIYLSVAAPQVAVEFRIEQVTQKVKKKFVVRISPDYDRLGALPQPEERWGAVFTVPMYATQAERADPALFAQHVRAQIAGALGVSAEDCGSIEDSKAFYQAVASPC